MVTKADFSAEEWTQLLQAPVAAGTAVVMANPSGLIGLMREMGTMVGAVQEATKQQDAGELVKAVAADFIATRPEAPNFEGRDPTAVRQEVAADLGKVADLLDAKAPAEADAFKRWLVSIGERVAKAASEGGFFGIGQEAVSAQERQAVQEISSVLRLSS